MFIYILVGKQNANNMAQEKLLSMREEIRSYQFWKAVRCEFLITLLYVFIGCGSTISWERHKPPDDLKVALAFGLSSATLVQCVGHISGAHMNPSVTMAMLVTRNITVLRAVFYIVAQCVGGIAGAGILYGVTPSVIHGLLGVTEVHDDVAMGQAFGVEFMITFIMVFTVFANLDPKRADMGSRSLAIGLSVALGQIFGKNYTGAGMNPARSLGPALVMNSWGSHWPLMQCLVLLPYLRQVREISACCVHCSSVSICGKLWTYSFLWGFYIYWVGPLLGGIIGGFTYEYTHDSSNHLQHLRRSFRRRPTSLKRTRSIQSTNSTLSTEMTYTPTSEDLRI